MDSYTRGIREESRNRDSRHSVTIVWLKAYGWTLILPLFVPLAPPLSGNSTLGVLAAYLQVQA